MAVFLGLIKPAKAGDPAGEVVGASLARGRRCVDDAFLVKKQND